MLIVSVNLQSQSKRIQPVWWFGESGAANFNYYQGLTQVLNNSFKVPTAFNKGQGVKPYASLLVEYRPKKIIGFMFNVAYDNRGGKFDKVLAPCNCVADLSTNLSYLSIEPAVRIAPFSSAFYLFAGPTISFNISRSFLYTQDKQNDVSGDFSDFKTSLLSAQVGAGIDIPVSSKTASTQMTVSPFISFQTNYGHKTRNVESWNVYTIRTGLALKFGSVGKKKGVLPFQSSQVAVTPNSEKDVQFSVRGPKAFAATRQVKETFPIRNAVFFNMGDTKIPDRYILLDQTASANFREEQLQENQPGNLNHGRSERQMNVYHNILNILGDRLRTNSSANILLTGSSNNDPAQGKLMAENVKKYLVNIYGISLSRIITEGRDKPVIASEKVGGTRDLELLKEGDRRVDITSNSPEMLLQVGGVSSSFLKPIQINAVQQDPLDAHVIFNVDSASENLKNWNVDITDESGVAQHYGPYYTDHASVPASTILADKDQGNYKVVMNAETKSGHFISKESSVSLVKKNDAVIPGLRYSILFDFDRYKTIDSYEKFLREVVAPLIPDNGTVIIHGHTDIIGEEAHNMKLSQERANSTQAILQSAANASGKKDIKFQSYGFGKDINAAPFENKFPEERFYNRTVIIDILGN